MSSNHLKRRPLQLESLERREVMAGNIAASVSDGLLTLTGNYQDNMVVLYQGANPNEVVVAGAKDYTGGNTLVNGSAAPVTLSGVTRIQADLRGGNDRVLITNLSLPVDASYSQRAIYAEMGEGNDQLVLSGNTGTPRNFSLNQGDSVPYGPVNIAGSTLVMGRAGNDTVSTLNASVNKLLVYGNDGNDTLAIDGSIAQNRIGSMYLDLGSGNDTVSLKRVQVASRVEIDRGRLPATGGTTKLEFYNFSAGEMDIDLMTSAQNTVTFNADLGKRNSLGEVRILLGSQDDAVSIGRSDFSKLGLDTRQGADQVEIVDSIFSTPWSYEQSLSIWLYDGNDKVTLQNVTSKKSTRIDGGSGVDQYIDAGGNALDNLIYDNME